jgi:hypothetical protein
MVSLVVFSINTLVITLKIFCRINFRLLVYFSFENYLT